MRWIAVPDLSELRSSGASVVALMASVAMLGLMTMTPARAEPLKLDTAASSVEIVFRQMGVDVDASFKKFDIDAQFDPADPSVSRARVVIDMASFDLGPGAEEYNDEVRAPDWFDTNKFPTATFEASGARNDGDNRFGVVGQLTIKGVSEPVKTQFVMSTENGRVALEGIVPVSRLAFNIGQGDWKDTSIVEDQVIVRFRIVGRLP